MEHLDEAMGEDGGEKRMRNRWMLERRLSMGMELEEGKRMERKRRNGRRP